MSARAKFVDFKSGLELRFGLSLSAFLAEAWPMTMRHWNEVGSNRDILWFNPDLDRYRALERQGGLHILCARYDGHLVGYLFLLILKHPRDKDALIARDDLFFVDPDFRRLRLGPKMIEAAIEYADGKAHILMLSEKLHRTRRSGNRGGYLAHFGFTPVETIWSRVLTPPHGDDK